MSCHIDIEAQEWSRLRLEWKRRDLPTALCTLILLPSNPNHSCNPPFNLTWQWPQVTLHLGNATEQDTGVYECSVNVEIPNLLSATGNGTALNVSASAGRPVSDTGLWWWLVIGGAAVGIVLLLAGGLCCYRHRHLCRKTDEETYENVQYYKQLEASKSTCCKGSHSKTADVYTVNLQSRGQPPVPPQPVHHGRALRAQHIHSSNQRAAKRP
ncbi:PREDICTED: transmembrane and immunoglobulin domain-containing protein 2 [Crocodylus porosus]|uniref:transmembrane and immunoglobulin domain-containing protein 2 n=1 Tax=Crocodylus porosus TaxID=8502 RepID=UPI00093C214C|nr:PREDICTED: transmembrane and immunoglobulin domain-containing protein 2 [Crocodylus porosus]